MHLTLIEFIVKIVWWQEAVGYNNTRNSILPTLILLRCVCSSVIELVRNQDFSLEEGGGSVTLGLIVIIVLF